MIVLGIDPGSRRVGYGLIEGHLSNARFIDAGLLPISDNADDAQALGEAAKGLRALIKAHKPDLFAIEKLYFSKNKKTAFRVAETRGALLLVAREAGMRCVEYSPNEIKLGLTGYGAADKRAVQKMVRLILKMPELDLIDDAADALGIALVAVRREIDLCPHS